MRTNLVALLDDQECVVHQSLLSIMEPKCSRDRHAVAELACIKLYGTWKAMYSQVVNLMRQDELMLLKNTYINVVWKVVVWLLTEAKASGHS